MVSAIRLESASFVAHTGSFAAPIGLSPPSAFGLVRRVLAGCYQSLLPMAASRRYSESLSLDAGPHTPAARRVLAPVSSTASSAFPHGQIGSASRVYPANDFSQGILSRLQVFRNVPASKFARPPDRPYRREYFRRAAGASTSEQNAVRCLSAVGSETGAPV